MRTHNIYTSIYRHMLNYIHTPHTSNLVPILRLNAVSQSFGMSTKCKQAPVALGACLRGNIPCSLLKPRVENNSVSVPASQYLWKEQMPESRTVLD